MNALLGILGATYKSIDIRAILGKSKHDNIWHCIFLKAYLTSRDPIEIEKKHTEMRICHIDNDRFKVAFKCKSIDQLDLFLNEIQHGEINIAGIVAKIVAYDYKTIMDRELINYQDFNEDNEELSYVHKLAYAGMTSSPAATIQELGITNSEMGIDLQDIIYCLGIDSMYKLNNIIMLLPIYCKILTVSSEEQGKYLAKYQIHKLLVNEFQAKVKVFPDGESRSPRYMDKIDLSNNVETTDEMITGKLPFTFTVQENDNIEIEIFHKSLRGLKITKSIWGHNLLGWKQDLWLKNVIERIDPSLETLRLWVEGKLPSLEEKNKKTNPKDFETAVTILLSLCGLRAVHVGRQKTDSYKDIK